MSERLPDLTLEDIRVLRTILSAMTPNMVIENMQNYGYTKKEMEKVREAYHPLYAKLKGY